MGASFPDHTIAVFTEGGKRPAYEVTLQLTADTEQAVSEAQVTCGLCPIYKKAALVGTAGGLMKAYCWFGVIKADDMSGAVIYIRPAGGLDSLIDDKQPLQESSCGISFNPEVLSAAATIINPLSPHR